MIVSASRRTDIPSLYAEWFLEKIKVGYVDVKNPFNANQIKRISLLPKDVDCFVFWTKYVSPFIPYLNSIKKYSYYFSFTITPYSNDLEINLPKKDLIIDGFKKLSETIGSEKVIWRYDPIIFTDKYDLNFHRKTFTEFCKKLTGYTNKCIVSFVTMYQKTKRNMAGINYQLLSGEDNLNFLNELAQISKTFSIGLETCAMDVGNGKFDFNPGACVDGNLINKIIETPQNFKKDKGQRNACWCVKSVDIGSYNTCKHGCIYCYANRNPY